MDKITKDMLTESQIINAKNEGPTTGKSMAKVSILMGNF